jgi:hypothetical protein
MADDEDIAALVVDNGSGMCKGTCRRRRNTLDALLLTSYDSEA